MTDDLNKPFRVSLTPEQVNQLVSVLKDQNDYIGTLKGDPEIDDDVREAMIKDNDKLRGWLSDSLTYPYQTQRDDERLARIEELEQAFATLWGIPGTDDAQDAIQDMLLLFKDELQEFSKWLKNVAGGHQVKDLLVNYFDDSMDGGWEGYTPQEKTAVRKFLRDIMLYRDHQD